VFPPCIFKKGRDRFKNHDGAFLKPAFCSYWFHFSFFFVVVAGQCAVLASFTYICQLL
jgi:hypothetical protein